MPRGEAAITGPRVCTDRHSCARCGVNDFRHFFLTPDPMLDNPRHLSCTHRICIYIYTARTDKYVCTFAPKKSSGQSVINYRSLVKYVFFLFVCAAATCPVSARRLRRVPNRLDCALCNLPTVKPTLYTLYFSGARTRERLSFIMMQLGSHTRRAEKNVERVCCGFQGCKVALLCAGALFLLYICGAARADARIIQFRQRLIISIVKIALRFSRRSM